MPSMENTLLFKYVFLYYLKFIQFDNICIQFYTSDLYEIERNHYNNVL